MKIKDDCGAIEKYIQSWPKEIREEIGEWFQGALCGHGSRLSKKASYRWKKLLTKLNN
jgi:hypothetical protein